jgi:voltage-gated potassium channel
MTKKQSWYNKYYGMLEHTHNPHFQIVNRVLGVVTLVAVLAVVLETVQVFSPYQFWINLLEWLMVLIFSFEYLVRFLVARHKTKYVFSFFGLVDAIAIIPTFLGLGNFTFLKSARSVRTIRLLRIARLAKLTRFKDEKVGKRAVLGINVEIYILALFMLITMLGAMFYLFESNLPDAENIPLGMAWVAKILVGGLSTPQPETLGGVTTLIMARFSAMIIFGFIIGIMGTVIRYRLTGSESD